MTTLVPIERIASKIYLIRNVKVMLDRDLAELYGVGTKRLKEQVRRNIERFPEDFMFELTKEELNNWRSQFATSNQDIMGLRIPPFAFSEHGVLMLSSVLKSERAVQVNIQIMRTFTKLREALLDNKDLRKELEGLKQITEERFQIVFETLDQLLTIESKPKKKIGYTVKEKQKKYGKKKQSKSALKN
jgi:phage regulator Rha-like protein